MMAANPTSSYHSPPQPPPHPHSLREQHAALQPHQPSSPLPGPSKQPPPRTKSAPMAPHLDDTKYMAKYKDLKQKVKDIELDNDRLHLKVIKTKKNIHRLRIERAILYERLSTMPVGEQPAQPQSYPGHTTVHPQQAPHAVHGQLQYAQPGFPPEVEAQIQAQNMARRHAEAQDMERRQAQPVFPPEVQAQIQANLERRQLETGHRGHPYESAPPGAHPMQSRADIRYPLGRPPSPPRPQHPLIDYIPPVMRPQPPHTPIEVDRPPPAPATRSRRSHPSSIHAHPALSRENDRSTPLPASLPPPPNTLPFTPPHPHSRQGSNLNHSPRLGQHERDHGPPGHPSEAGYPQYAGPSGPRRTSSLRDRERDRERPHLGGPGLPPIRTRHPDAHSQSPRPASSSSHSGYAHPLQHPFSSPDDRGWEREREFPPQHMRMEERQDPRLRERRDLREPSHSNGSAGYRDGPSRRYEADTNQGNGPPPDNYGRSRRSSQGHVRAESSTDSRGQDRDRDRREYPQDYQYEYARRQDGQDPEMAHAGQSRRRSYGEMETDHPEAAYERPIQKRSRGSQDEIDRRQLHREPASDKEDVAVPRVQEGDAME